MVTKPKAPAKSAGAAKSAKSAVKRPAKVAAKKAPAKAPTKPMAAKKPPLLAPKSAKPAAKPAAAPKAVVAAKAAAPAKPSTGGRGPRLGVVPPSGNSSVAAVPSSNLPPPKPPVRQAVAISPKDLASAHEYLVSRSAGRSEAPVIVDGKPLPTEEQLLSMPESDYMNADQLAFFRHRLQQIEREILNNADETTEHLRETVIVPDPADRATIEEEHALELRTRDRERKLLKKVQQSLAQIESGEYGFCEETGDPIGIPRLLARPTATLSLEAQQRREIKQKLFGD